MKRYKKAFTLIEMLVALILISLLIGVALFSFRMQLITISKTKMKSIDKVVKYSQIKSLIESMKYYVVERYDTLDRPMKKLHYFFKGSQKSMLFITTNPIFSNEDAIVKMYCDKDKLYYTEEPLFKRVNFLKPTLLKDSKMISLYKDVKECSFSYITIDGKKIFNLKDSLPKAVSISIKTNFGDRNLYSEVRSDNNKTIYEIYDAMYPHE